MDVTHIRPLSKDESETCLTETCGPKAPQNFLHIVGLPFVVRKLNRVEKKASANFFLGSATYQAF